VTPELYRLCAGDLGCDVIAVDNTPAMIEAVWRGPRNRVVCGDWRRLPVRPRSRDLALCDGGLHLLSHPDGQRALVRSLREVLAPGGLVVLRLFAAPERRESPETVLADLLAGRVDSLNVLKLRLGMSLQPSATEGVELASVWAMVRGASPSFAALAETAGWELSHLTAIDTYRDCRRRYHFVSVRDACELFESGGFELMCVRTPGSYPLAERCPTLVFRSRVQERV
jgi:SAM-dependent methyltransferase